MFDDPKVGMLPSATRWFFVGLLTQADREGRLEDDPLRLKCRLAAYDAQTDADQCLTELHEAGLIVRYQVDGRRYIQISTFHKHQRCHPQEQPSNIPPVNDLAVIPGKNTASSGISRRNGSLDSGSLDSGEGEGRRARAAAPAAFRVLDNGQRKIQLPNSPERRATDARSKRPIFDGRKLTVFEWQLDDCLKTLGSHADAFDLHAWFFDLDAKAFETNLVIPKRDSGVWLQQQLVAEAQRRGLPIRVAGQVGKSTTRLASALANIAAEGER